MELFETGHCTAAFDLGAALLPQRSQLQATLFQNESNEAFGACFTFTLTFAPAHHRAKRASRTAYFAWDHVEWTRLRALRLLGPSPSGSPQSSHLKGEDYGSMRDGFPDLMARDEGNNLISRG
jgi:hypothetical protein